jgi:hypothetical protein
MPQLATLPFCCGAAIPEGEEAHQRRAIRALPEELWKELERKARSQKLNLHQAMRAALLGWLRRAT